VRYNRISSTYLFIVCWQVTNTVEDGAHAADNDASHQHSVKWYKVCHYFVDTIFLSLWFSWNRNWSSFRTTTDLKRIVHVWNESIKSWSLNHSSVSVSALFECWCVLSVVDRTVTDTHAVFAAAVPRLVILLTTWASQCSAQTDQMEQTSVRFPHLHNLPPQVQCNPSNISCLLR